MADTSKLRGQLATRAEHTIADLINRQRSEIARALPKHMDADRLARIAITTIKTTPTLMQCSAPSLLGALMLSAQTGMEPGPLGHAYLVPRKSRDRGWEVTWILGYKGIIELARRSGQILSIEAREVCERDEFDYEFGLDEKLVHRPYMDGDRGPIVAFWGLAKFKDGGHYFLVMSKADVDKAKERSDAGRNNKGPWVTDYAAMGRKTVIRRMAPFLPLSPEQAQVIAHDETVNTRIAPGLTEEPPEAGWVMDADAWETGGDLPAGDTPDGQEEGDEDSDGDAPVDDRPPTQAMMRKLFAALNYAGVADEERHQWAAGKLGRDVGSFDELTRGDVHRLIDVAEPDGGS
jgi:recombination protein RecT